ncbi:hypothetical protein ACH5RR_005388 [Cinchona calisaya]|uniref:Uncharacterized protein n=1 Tax=Cinchona calisaya TaxID=153742 RepID=A0ABD3AL29_9GENT
MIDRRYRYLLVDTRIKNQQNKLDRSGLGCQEIERNVTNELPAQNEAIMKRKKQRKPENLLANPTAAQKMIEENVIERISIDGMDMMEWERTKDERR